MTTQTDVYNARIAALEARIALVAADHAASTTNRNFDLDSLRAELATATDAPTITSLGAKIAALQSGQAEADTNNAALNGQLGTQLATLRAALAALPS